MHGELAELRIDVRREKNANQKERNDERYNPRKPVLVVWREGSDGQAVR